jgi:hypothetical protein
VNGVKLSEVETDEGNTFIAIATLVGLWRTRWTVPYAPLPSSSPSCSWFMLMAKDGPLEKSTPEECRIALPLKFSAPDGSLG